MPLIIHLQNGGTLQPRFSQEEDTAFVKAFQSYLSGAPQTNGSEALAGCRFHLVGDSPSYMVLNFAHVTHILENPTE